MCGSRLMLLLVAGCLMWASGVQSVRADSPDCWLSPPEPDAKSPADYVAWALRCEPQTVAENAWPLYAQLEERFIYPQAREVLWLGRAVRWQWDDERYEPLVPWLDKSREWFDLLRKASTKPGCVAPVKRDGPYLLNLAITSKQFIRVTARAMAADGWRRVAQGDPEPLIQDSLVILRVAHHLDELLTGSGRTGKGYFARMVYRDLLLQLLDRTDRPGEFAARLLKSLSEADPPFGSQKRAVSYQYAILADLYQRIYAHDAVVDRLIMDQAELEPFVPKLNKVAALSNEDMVNRLLPSEYGPSIAFLKEHFSRMEELVDLPFAESHDKIMALEEKLEREGTYLNRMTVRNMWAYVAERQQTIASRRATRLVFAIWAHHRKNGRFPSSLDELAFPDLGELRRDPFSAGDFVYRRTQDGFTLYSLATDCASQNGEHKEDWGEEAPGDYVFWPVQPITPPWLRPRILITSDGRIIEQDRSGTTRPADTHESEDQREADGPEKIPDDE